MTKEEMLKDVSTLFESTTMVQASKAWHVEMERLYLKLKQSLQETKEENKDD